MNREEFIEMLKDVLTFETHTPAPRYDLPTTLRVMVDGEVIAEVDV